jgi:ribulose bisphosphate carboxylase small subunit
MAYYVSPRFLDKLAVHITKNYLDLPNVKVPLILGVHGRKGEGKSFQCELVFERMGLQVVHMSAGELESPDAGDAARLIRLRYREAAELVKVRGKMAVLMINDIDAGAGRVDQYTQYTVNTQLVNGTLMNIADNPTNVQLPGAYDSDPIQRIPIIATGNDFSTLYAPLVRDGRMDKFFWEPSREDRVGIVSGIFERDSVGQAEIAQLVDTFPDQAIDFYGALRSRLYDEQVQALVRSVGYEKISQRVVNSIQAPPEFQRPDFRLEHLVEVGNQLVLEQRRVQESRLAEEYNKSLYFNRKLGQTREQTEIVPSSASPEQAALDYEMREGFYRGYRSAPESASVSAAATPAACAAASPLGQSSATALQPEWVALVNQMLALGNQVGIEQVDKRRFRTQSWGCYGLAADATSVLEQLERCVREYPQNYIRLVEIQSGDRKRLREAVIQRPS